MLISVNEPYINEKYKPASNGISQAEHLQDLLKYCTEEYIWGTWSVFKGHFLIPYFRDIVL